MEKEDKDILQKILSSLACIRDGYRMFTEIQADIPSYMEMGHRLCRAIGCSLCPTRSRIADPDISWFC